MSEHTSIKGKTDYWHLPYREKGFTYCKRCKEFDKKAEIEFHEGWFSDWMCVRCGHCRKAIWVCSFKNSEVIEEKYQKQKRGKRNKEVLDEEGIRKFIKDDKKCAYCKNPTNHYDCFASGGPININKTFYWCSKKCEDKWDKNWRKCARKKKSA